MRCYHQWSLDCESQALPPIRLDRITRRKLTSVTVFEARYSAQIWGVRLKQWTMLGLLGQSMRNVGIFDPKFVVLARCTIPKHISPVAEIHVRRCYTKLVGGAGTTVGVTSTTL